jgi:rhodanese-related sulfurtransferase
MKIHIQSRKFGGDLIGVCILATVSVCLGLLINQFRDHRLPLIYATKQQRLEEAMVQVASAAATPVPIAINAPAAAENPRVIGLEEFRKEVEGKKSIIFDARPEIFHRFGHVPGAISFPREDFENSYSKYKSLLESDKNQTLTVYCSSQSCEDSDMVADALVKLGYGHVLVFKGGWDEWSATGLPQEGKQ